MGVYQNIDDRFNFCRKISQLLINTTVPANTSPSGKFYKTKTRASCDGRRNTVAGDDDRWMNRAKV